MTSFLSAISGHFTRVLIMGTVLPLIMFLVAAFAVLLPVLPDWGWIERFFALEREWQIAALLFVIIVGTGILQNLNTPIVRLYEGYPWQHSWIGRRRKARHATEFKRLTAQDAGLRALRDYIRFKQGRTANTAKIDARRLQIQLALENYFPRMESSVLPTTLGNVVRSFEAYPYKRYGMEAITLWPRLESVLEASQSAAIDGAKSQFDFMINASLLSAALAFGLLFSGTFGFLPTPQRLLIAAQIVLLCFLAYLFYRGAINRALAWGTRVKAAFDLYRPELLKKLGVAIVPVTPEEEKKLWERISSRLIYGNPVVGLAPVYRHDYPLAEAAEPGLRFEVTRSLVASDSGITRIRLAVRNCEKDADRRAADAVLHEKLPDHALYMAGSARRRHLHADGRRGDVDYPKVVGANPYHFAIGTLEPGDRVLIEYDYLAQKE